MALQNVIVMQNSMKVVYKWKKSSCVEVKKHSHEGPNLVVEKTNIQRKKFLECQGKTVEGIPPISVAQAQVSASVRGPCAEVVPRTKFNQTGTQTAWGSPLVPLVGDVWLYGLLRATGSIAEDLATGPL